MSQGLGRAQRNLRDMALALGLALELERVLACLCQQLPLGLPLLFLQL